MNWGRSFKFSFPLCKVSRFVSHGTSCDLAPMVLSVGAKNLSPLQLRFSPHGPCVFPPPKDPHYPLPLDAGVGDNSPPRWPDNSPAFLRDGQQSRGSVRTTCRPTAAPTLTSKIPTLIHPFHPAITVKSGI